jgi:hypothetical protein
MAKQISVTVMKAKYRAEKLGLSAAVLANIIGVSPTSLANAFRGVSQLSPQVEADLDSKTSILERIHDAMHPFPLPTDVAMLSELTQTKMPAEEMVAFVKQVFYWQE